MNNIEKPEVKPSVYYGFIHLNKRVTILGYPPIIGGLLTAAGIMLFFFTITFRSKGLLGISLIYLPAFVWYTIKNIRCVKENRLEVLSLLFYEPKRKIYVDHDNVINSILKHHE